MNRPKTHIRDTLLRLGLISNDRIRLFSPRTRDCDSLPVYRDEETGVIFIDDYYTGEDTYGVSRAFGRIRDRP